MIHVLTKCPVCTNQLTAVKLQCRTCGTQIENSFDFPKIMHLTKEQLEFVEVFIMARGNIKDVEKALNISYPTVRAKLDQVIEALSDGKKPSSAEVEEKNSPTKTSKARQEILDKLERGEISTEEAVQLLKQF